MYYVKYLSNNSGGEWWLNDDDWKKLEIVGWKVVWANLEYLYNDKGDYVYDVDGTPKLIPIEQSNSKMKCLHERDSDGNYRYLGALVKTAFRVGLHLREAVDEWEKVTGKQSTDAGCPCCGKPHNFYEYNDNGEIIASGKRRDYQ